MAEDCCACWTEARRRHGCQRSLTAGDADPYRRVRYLPAVRDALQLLADRLDRIATEGRRVP